MPDRSPRDTILSYDIEGEESATTASVLAVAAVSDNTVSELAPLNRKIDPDALNALIEVNSGVSVTFQYGGFELTIHGNTVVVKD